MKLQTQQELNNLGTQKNPANYELLNEKEAAAILRVSVSKLQKDRIRGDGVPFVSLGRSVRYKTKDIISYIEENTRSSTSQVLKEQNRT
jgi:hypothetical protein